MKSLMSLLCASFLTGMPLQAADVEAAPSPTVAQKVLASPWTRIVVQLEAVRGQVDQFLAIQSYAEELEAARRPGDGPPAPPSLTWTTDHFVKKLKTTRSRISGLKLPDLALKRAPTPKEVWASSLDNLSRTIDKAEAGLSDEATAQKQMEEMLAGLIAYSKVVSGSSRALAVLKKSLETAVIHSTLAAQWLDIELKIQPQINGLRGDLTKKLQELQKKAPSRRQDFTNLVSALSIFQQGAVERASKERVRVEALLTEIDQAPEKISAAQAKLDRLKLDGEADFRKKTAAIATANQQRTELDQKKTSAWTAYNRASDRVAELWKYSGCPEGYSYDRCVHEDIKANWRRANRSAIDRRDAAEQAYDRAKRSYRDKRSEVERLQNELNAARAAQKRAVSNQTGALNKLISQDYNKEWLEQRLEFVVELEGKSQHLGISLEAYQTQ